MHHHPGRGIVPNFEAPNELLLRRHCDTAAEPGRHRQGVQAYLLVWQVQGVPKRLQAQRDAERIAIRVARELPQGEDQLVFHQPRKVAEACQRDHRSAEGLEPVTGRRHSHSKATAGTQSHPALLFHLLLLGEVCPDAAAERLALMFVIKNPPLLLVAALLGLVQSGLQLLHFDPGAAVQGLVPAGAGGLRGAFEGLTQRLLVGLRPA
mmetsp:Transcript_98978/g.236185  ORF Transcript_98978/g.236185 Transcript_98978/m.236185 type:complete len:208 (+) Transcript_98978:2027-2650(+)